MLQLMIMRYGHLSDTKPALHNYLERANILHSLGNINKDLNNIQKGKKYYLRSIDTCKVYKDNHEKSPLGSVQSFEL